MPRITVDISIFTYQYLEELKTQRGSSISFEAHQLLEQAIRERNRKKKLPLQDGSKDVQVPDHPTKRDQS